MTRLTSPLYTSEQGWASAPSPNPSGKFRLRSTWALSCCLSRFSPSSILNHLQLPSISLKYIVVSPPHRSNPLVEVVCSSYIYESRITAVCVLSLHWFHHEGYLDFLVQFFLVKNEYTSTIGRLSHYIHNHLGSKQEWCAFIRIHKFAWNTPVCSAIYLDQECVVRNRS